MQEHGRVNSPDNEVAHPDVDNCDDPGEAVEKPAVLKRPAGIPEREPEPGDEPKPAPNALCKFRANPMGLRVRETTGVGQDCPQGMR